MTPRPTDYATHLRCRIAAKTHRNRRIAAAAQNTRIARALASCDPIRTDAWVGDILLAGPLFGHSAHPGEILSIYAEDAGERPPRLYIDHDGRRTRISRSKILRIVANAMRMRSV